jgi:Cellulase (glycosyl hydrolase family 5)
MTVVCRPLATHWSPRATSNFAGRRRHRRAAVVAVAALVLAGGVGWRLLAPTTGCRSSPVVARELSRLQSFEVWLQRNHARGYVAEVGWPGTVDAADWNRVGAAWFNAADRDRLWVSAWAAGPWWPPSYPMAAYRFPTDAARSAVVRGAQASVLEAHTEATAALRGIDIPSGAFGTADDGDTAYSDHRPGVYGVDYRYDDYSDYRYLAARGFQMIRLSVAWERLQPRLGQPLDGVELARVRDTVAEATRAGLGVIIDLHNFGGYWVSGPTGPSHRLALGSTGLPASALADFWARMATAFHDVSGILGYGLMNEPRQLAADPEAGARIWQQAAQAVVTAIRATADRRMVSVAAYGGSAPEQFQRLHPRAWIDDPAGAVRYEAHQYFDDDGSGQYSGSFAEEETTAAADVAAVGSTPGQCVTSKGETTGGR